jgi:hypothetical protein
MVAFFGMPRDGFPFITISPDRKPHAARVEVWGIGRSDVEASSTIAEMVVI